MAMMSIFFAGCDKGNEVEPDRAPAANENSGSFITMESLILPSRTVCAEREYCFRGYTYDASILAFMTGDISTAALRRRISDSSATGDTAADQQGCRSFFCYHKQKIKVRGRGADAHRFRCWHPQRKRIAAGVPCGTHLPIGNDRGRQSVLVPCGESSEAVLRQCCRSDRMMLRCSSGCSETEITFFCDFALMMLKCSR